MHRGMLRIKLGVGSGFENLIVSRHSHAALPVYFSIDVNPPGAQGRHLRQSPVQRMLDMGKWKKESAPWKSNLLLGKMERERGCKSSSRDKI
jgi:hypothetical protein